MMAAPSFRGTVCWEWKMLSGVMGWECLPLHLGGRGNRCGAVGGGRACAVLRGYKGGRMEP